MMNDQVPTESVLYPLRFEPLYQYRLWGGRRLARWVRAPLPDDEPVGEAWLLSDRDDHPSRVAEGALKGHSLTQLIQESPAQLLGKYAGHGRRFPLLLKFLDARDTLSVQVHPSDRKTDYLPKGETGKTEAWVVLETGAKSCIYAGLTANSTEETVKQALREGTVADHLASFTPKTGDAILIPAGAVHSLGDVVVFEIQENSDVTFRLFDWNHVDTKTAQPRPLQVEQALACLDFAQKAIGPVVPFTEMESPALRERLITCDHFGLWRLSGTSPFSVGQAETPRVLVCLFGEGHLEHDGARYTCRKGDVFLLPATVGACLCRPGAAMTVLEISLPEEA